MAICTICNREMKTAHGCVAHSYVHNGKTIPAIKCGSPEEDFPVGDDYICHDCNARPGEYHHPGCDVERCPVCGGQLISCGCYGDRLEVSVADDSNSQKNAEVRQ